MATIIVGMADWKVAKGSDILTTLGLGSCVGVTFWDKAKGIGGMGHFMLPSSEGYSNQNRAKFADTCIQDLLVAITRAGAVRGNLVAKIAGGAHMFSAAGAGNVLKVGERNAAIAKEILSDLKIPLLANDTGGTHGRTIELNIADGKLKIRTVGFGEKFV
jgi:chemotaxis protein CheD